MSTLPQLIEEDVQRLDEILRELLAQTDGSTALVIDKGGFLIGSCGDSRQFDLTTIAALASGAYMANQTIANLVHEANFNSVYQQGEKHSMFVLSVDEYCMLVVIFKAQVSVGVVKYFSAPAAASIAEQLHAAQQRDPSGGLDLSVLNVADTSDFFKRQRGD
jgi:predicted regulator of Ras-like GTPase activity (Roadblock/LC7/MglB family)